MKTLGALALAVLIGAVFGSLLTFNYTASHKTDQVVKQANTVVAATATAVVKAVEEDVRIEEKIDAGKANAELAKQEVLKQLKPTKEVVYVNIPGKTEYQACPPITRDSVMPLSISGVRLLNDLRAYRTIDLTKLDATEGETSAGITIAQFVSNDMDVVALYNELAVRHNELVDAVVDYMRKDAARRSSQ